MSTNELDRLIVKNVSRVSYEYDAGDWEKLTQQLAAARRKKRTMVFAYSLSGIAASVAVLLICIFPLYTGKEIVAVRYASKSHTFHQVPSVLKTDRGADMPATQSTKPYTASVAVARKTQSHPAFDTVADDIPVIINKDQQVNTLAIKGKEHTDTFDFKQKPSQPNSRETKSLSYTQPKDRSNNKAINIDLVGGVNSGLTNTGYAIGTAVGKRVSNKFGVEVTVAYVGNTALASASQAPAPSSGGGIFIPPVKPAPTPAPVVTSPLNYLQFAPMAGYSLSKKITLSGGADMQRLLQDHAATVWYKGDEKVAPLVDFGISLKTEYAVFRFLKAGLSYRLGANNLVSPGNKYIDRNYLQVQVKYKLYNRENRIVNKE